MSLKNGDIVVTPAKEFITILEDQNGEALPIKVREPSGVERLWFLYDYTILDPLQAAILKASGAFE